MVHLQGALSKEDLAKKLGISIEAAELTIQSEVIDTHIEPFLWMRLIGYDVGKRHGTGLLGGRLYSHLDIPRVLEGGLTAAMWSIVTNPMRSAKGRWKAFLLNLERLLSIAAADPTRVRVATTMSEYRKARADGAHALIPAIQGGDALEGAPESTASIPNDAITRITLVHLMNSCYGVTSSPFALFRSGEGLTDAGRALVKSCNAQRIFVDLAHINPPGFWDAVEVHDRSQPLIVTHTGVTGVTPHWRNIDDRQIKAIADTGGTIGIIYAENFLRTQHVEPGADQVVEHMRHVIDVAGEDFVSIGSDYDGFIVPPKDLRSGESYAVLVEKMLRRGWKVERIQKILGLNFLRAFEALRP